MNNLVEVSIKQVEVFSIIASVISIVLGILAIVLAIVFYVMSVKSAKEVEKSSDSINSSVKKLEILFDKLYSGTFDMMRETVTDMRKHVYSSSNSSPTESISKQVEKETSEIVSRVVNEIRQNQKSDEELEKIILNMISKSKQLEQDAKLNTIRDILLAYLKIHNGATFKQIRGFMIKRGLLQPDNDPSLFSELEQLVKEDKIIDPFEVDYHDGKNFISYDAEIILKPDDL